MAAMPWEYMPPTEETTVPNRITNSTSQRMPGAAQSGRIERVRGTAMDSAVFGVDKGDIVTSPRGYDQP
ncbi:MAG: hypothetical protein C0449_20480 [Polaromonas sp.]|nr:hypothetical protein [Polaromonas sp.]